MKAKLGPIVIGVKNIEKSKTFYVNVFGIEIKEQSVNYLSAYLGDTHIELEEDSPNRFPKWAERNIGTFKNSEFTVPDLEVFLNDVTVNGGEIVSKPLPRPWGGMNAEIADLDGNIFLISQEG